jgi:uncharacterized membrane protein YfcA
MEIVIIIVTVVAAYVLKAITGFGTSLIIIPVLSVFFDLKTAIMIAAIGDVISNSILMIKDREKITFPKLKTLALGLFLGTFLGVSMLNIIDTNILRKFLAIFILIYIASQFFHFEIPVNNERSKNFLGYVFGVIGGICGGLFNTNGPAIYIYTNNVFKDKNIVKANMAILFLVDSIWRTSLYVSEGNIDFKMLSLFLIIILPSLLFGLAVGTYLDKKVEVTHFHKLSKTILFVSGLKLLFW